jgi:hypothetical protein
MHHKQSHYQSRHQLPPRRADTRRRLGGLLGHLLHVRDAVRAGEPLPRRRDVRDERVFAAGMRVPSAPSEGGRRLGRELQGAFLGRHVLSFIVCRCAPPLILLYFYFVSVHGSSRANRPRGWSMRPARSCRRAGRRWRSCTPSTRTRSPSRRPCSSLCPARNAYVDSSHSLRSSLSSSG